MIFVHIVRWFLHASTAHVDQRMLGDTMRETKSKADCWFQSIKFPVFPQASSSLVDPTAVRRADMLTYQKLT